MKTWASTFEAFPALAAAKADSCVDIAAIIPAAATL